MESHGWNWYATWGTSPADIANSSQTQKELPLQFLHLPEPVDARVVIGSFGGSEAYDSSVFKLAIERDPNVPVPTVEAARYGKLPEIHHIFKDSPSNPAIIITLAFVLMVSAALPVLAGLVSVAHVVSSTLLTLAVALPRRQPQPPPNRIQVFSSASRYLPWVVDCLRGYLLPLLHLLEPVPNPARCGSHWRGRIRERKSRLGGSAGPAPCWIALKLDLATLCPAPCLLTSTRMVAHGFPSWMTLYFTLMISTL